MCPSGKVAVKNRGLSLTKRVLSVIICAECIMSNYAYLLLQGVGFLMDALPRSTQGMRNEAWNAFHRLADLGADTLYFCRHVFFRRFWLRR